MNTTTSLTAAHTASGAVRTPWTEFVRKFRKQHLAMVAGYFVLFLIVVGRIIEVFVFDFIVVGGGFIPIIFLGG